MAIAWFKSLGLGVKAHEFQSSFSTYKLCDLGQAPNLFETHAFIHKIRITIVPLFKEHYVTKLINTWKVLAVVPGTLCVNRVLAVLIITNLCAQIQEILWR